MNQLDQRKINFKETISNQDKLDLYEFYIRTGFLSEGEEFLDFYKDLKEEYKDRKQGNESFEQYLYRDNKNCISDVSYLLSDILSCYENENKEELKKELIKLYVKCLEANKKSLSRSAKTDKKIVKEEVKNVLDTEMNNENNNDVTEFIEFAENNFPAIIVDYLRENVEKISAIRSTLLGIYQSNESSKLNHEALKSKIETEIAKTIPFDSFQNPLVYELARFAVIFELYKSKSGQFNMNEMHFVCNQELWSELLIKKESQGELETMLKKSNHKKANRLPLYVFTKVLTNKIDLTLMSKAVIDGCINAKDFLSLTLEPDGLAGQLEEGNFSKEKLLDDYTYNFRRRCVLGRNKAWGETYYGFFSGSPNKKSTQHIPNDDRGNLIPFDVLNYVEKNITSWVQEQVYVHQNIQALEVKAKMLQNVEQNKVKIEHGKALFTKHKSKYYSRTDK